MLTFLEKVTGSVDTGSAVDTVFFDFAKAFDTGPKKTLFLCPDGRVATREGRLAQ